MKNIVYNTGYFLKEVKTMMQLNLLSNVFSLVSIGLIFFILTMVILGWWISNEVVEVMQGEAEINAYFHESIDNTRVSQLVKGINGIEGVREARVVDEEEAYGRMVEILGQEARVLEFFDDNPFSPFIEIRIYLEEMDAVLEELQFIGDIEHVRDNREVLDRLRNITGVLRLLGYLIVAAVGISTLVIISHIIRQEIYNNREQINTLRLLGAPEAFIAFPFLLKGLLLTLGGGMVAVVLASLALKYLYLQVAGPLPFIPMPSREVLTLDLVILMMFLSTILGIIGSLLGLSSAKNH
ncbi:cell division protein FtsX [Natronincola ferrireducens]|uniref:Cell division protein FtsX n=1 Tax=Natronincola ferrireducens TaxID=393762 RepID=A0A1G9DUE2_9FIRM|nr:permease-like cell division protein FtsX [Natronincola ferrireducens]SDK67442.1 cell division protein FtsX [Natronincola ferrireducens]